MPAAAGVVLVAEPWHGEADPVAVACALGAAACWGLFILLTRRVGEAVSGLSGLAISMPVAGVAATLIAGPATIPATWEPVLIGLGLALLVPVIPFALEMLALRRHSIAFGTLMSLEPAIALVVGLLALHQVPGAVPVIGLLCVVVAGIGAERTGARSRTPLPGPAGLDLPARA